MSLPVTTHVLCSCNACSDLMTGMLDYWKCEVIHCYAFSYALSHNHFRCMLDLSSMRLNAKTAVVSINVMNTRNAYGKSSCSESNALFGCIRAKKRSKPYASMSEVDSKLAGAVAMPASGQVYGDFSVFCLYAAEID